MRSFKSIGISIGVAVLKHPQVICLPFFALIIGVTWLVRHNFFFWDTIQLAAQHALFFYNTTPFSTFLLPDSMDSGHPPTFGFYLALVWRLFGKSLEISHLAMLPFLLGIIWQVWKLGEKIVGEGWALLFLLLLTVCPVVAGQAVLVSPDIVLLFFFFMALNGIFNEHNSKLNNHEINIVLNLKFNFNTPLIIGILGLSAISMRGMMVVAGLFIFYCFIKIPYLNALITGKKPKAIDGVIVNHPVNLISEFNFIASYLSRTFIFNSKHPLSIKGIFSIISPFLLGISFAFSFLSYHFIQKGWIGFHTDSPWMPAFERVNAMDFIKNIALLIWRFLDFGHLFLWLICLYGLIKVKKIAPTKRLLITLLIVLLCVLTPTLLIYKGLLAHRYLMPIYVVLILLTTRIISDLKNYKRQLILALMAFIGLASGNFWVYPQPISTGWDATLAHLPYYELRREMLQFIDNQQLNYKDIGTAFPNQRDFETTDLKKTAPSRRNRDVVPPSVQNHFSTYNLEKNHFIFYSNVMNEFSDADLNALKKNWHSIKSLKKGQIEVILFEKNHE